MPCMVPSSPYGPCRTGKTTSTEARPAGNFSVVGAGGQVAAFRLQLTHRLPGGDPTPLPGYADRHDFVVPTRLQRPGYGARGGQGYLVLPAAAPEDDHHPDQCAAPLFSSPSILAKGVPEVLFSPFAV